jgi:PAS domain S-box-containing protein
VKLFSQTRVINLLLLIGMVILTVSGILAYRQVNQLVNANSWIVHTLKVIEASNLTLLSLTESESRINYYVITNDKSVIQELPKLISVAQQSIRLLKQLTQDNPIQETRIKGLESLVNARIALMQQIALINYVTNKQAGLQLATSQKRNELKTAVTQTVADINQEEDNLLNQRYFIAAREMKLSNSMFIIFGSLSELFIILSFILLNHNLYRRNIAERKQTETENKLLLSNTRLQASEERYLLAMEGSSAGLWDWEVGTNQVFYSPYFKKMLGYTDEEFPNVLESFEKSIHPQDHDRLWESVHRHFEDHTPFKIEYRLRTKSGDYHWFQVAAQALWDEAGIPTRMSGSIIDISDRKKAEQRLRIQHAVAEILSEGSSLEVVSIKIIKIICEDLGWVLGAIWMVDNAKNVLQCIGIWRQPSPLLNTFEDENSKMQFAYGVDIPGRVWKSGEPSWLVDVDKNNNFTRAKIAKEAGLHSVVDFPIIIQKKVLGVIECFTTEQESLDEHMLDLMMTVGSQIAQFIGRKRAENELRESEAYKTAILESASDSIITIDEQKNIVSFNSQTAKEFHYLNEELQYKNIEMILPNVDLTIGKFPDKPSIEILGIRKNGESFPVDIKISEMSIDKRKTSVIIVRDITERKKIEKIKNEFISVVSHELRTPLTSIRGALGLVLGGSVGDFPEKVKKLLDLANNNCERLLLLINDILDMEKLDAGKMNFEFKVVDIGQLVNEAIGVNKIYAKKYGIRLTLAPSASNVKVYTDPNRVMQVLTNLISNAVKFSPKGEEVILTIKQNQKNARVLISNKGPGISDEFQSRVFQKFSQADSSNTRGKGGTGLGLNISKAIIEKLGGTLNFISKPDEITTFYFDFPLREETQKIIQSQKRKASLGDQDRILICEDDEDQASYLSKLLEGSCFQVDVSRTVAEAKKLLAMNNYHVLLLDLILPDQDGISFIRELRSKEETRVLPIIVISMIAETGRSLLNGEAFSVLDWLEKPIQFDKLLRAIEHIRKKTHPNLPNVLHVEDDPDTFEVVRNLLENHANVVSASTIPETIDKLKNLKFDLVILDLILPDGNAEELLPLIAEYKLPVIVYSSIELDKSVSSVVKHVLVKSKTSNEQLVNLIKHELETSS